LNHYNWRLHPGLPLKHPLQNTQYPPLIRQLLYNRGILDPAQAEVFFQPDNRLENDAMLLNGMAQAISRIYKALLSGEQIAIYGDFDVDGITSTALLVKGLRALGGRVISYIPHRLQEGHGLNDYALSEIKERGVNLVITTDCGITGVKQVRKACRAGMDVIITDHHLPEEELPSAIAVIDPHCKNDSYPFKELAGVGVAYKLLSALYGSLGRAGEVKAYLDLVALGTVADMVPLTGENRYLVIEGLKQLRANPSPGIQELALQAGISVARMSADDISWVLAPRLNAAGRMEDAKSSYQLLITDSIEEASNLAQWLNEKNCERQKLTAAAFIQAKDEILSRGISPILMARNSQYAGGILGLVAGKLVEEFYRPAVVIQVDEELSHASCRSIPEFNITLALHECSDLLLQHGGHSMAAGFTVPTKNIPELEKKLSWIASRELQGLDLRPRLEIDSVARFSDLGGGSYQMLQQMAPFGQGNPAAVFMSGGVKAVDCRPMGSSGQHLRLKLKQANVIWEAVAFGMGDRAIEMQLPLDVVYNLEQDEWNGGTRLRLNLLDFAVSGTDTGFYQGATV
jgi:single-stranded-DNA-specific exonuclease